MQTLFRIAAYSLATIALAGCATKVGVMGKFAPQSGLSTDETPKRIAVFDFDGQLGQTSAIELEAALAQAKYEGKPFFTIVDRNKTGAIMGEFARKVRGELDPATAAKFGRQIGAEGILFGTVGHDFHTKHSTMETNECRAYDKKNKCLQWVKQKVKCADRSASFSIAPRLVRVDTAQVAYASPKGGTASTSYCSGASQSVSDEALLSQARQQAMAEIRRDLAPYEMMMKVKLKDDTDGMEDAAKESFKGAIEFADSGRMDRACEIWRKLQADGTKTVALLYNVAVCIETEGKMPKALVAYQDVDRLLTVPDKDVNEALARVGSQIEEQKKMRSSAGS